MPNSQEPLKVALLGYGLAGSAFHAPLIATTPGLSLAAVVTSNKERQTKAHAEFPDAELLNSADEVFSNAKRFDIVVIATPNIHHAPLAQKSLHSRLATVIDKPIATTSCDAEELVAISEETNTLLTVFQNRRWDNDFLTLRKLIDDGTLQSVYRFESRFERWRPAVNKSAWRETSSLEEAGGLLFDLGSHLIDQALVLFGEPVHIYAETELRRPGATADDDSFVAIKFANGVTAHLWMNAISAIQGPRFRVLAANGSYEKFGLDPQEADLRAGKRPPSDEWGKEPISMNGTLKYLQGDETLEKSVVSEPGAYSEFYRLLESAVRNGTAPPVNPRDALKTMRVIETAIKCGQEALVTV
ncbi:MAG: Gfo/Idh/MocA family oxidoreductase [Candidatus Obscuribacterales bacterium]